MTEHTSNEEDGYRFYEKKIMAQLSGQLAARMAAGAPGLETTAYHEAGHTVVYRFGGWNVYRVEVFEDGSGTTYYVAAGQEPPTADELARITTTTDEIQSDEEKIAADTRTMILCGRLPDFADLERRTTEILREHWSVVCRIARALIQRRELTGEEIDELYEDPLDFYRKTGANVCEIS